MAHFRCTLLYFDGYCRFLGKNASIEPGEILTLENAEVIDGQIKVVDKFNNVFSISSAFYRYLRTTPSGILHMFSRLCNVLTSTGWYFDSGTFSNWPVFSQSLIG